MKSAALLPHTGHVRIIEAHESQIAKPMQG